MSPEDQAHLNVILDDFCRTYVTFRPVKCETVGHSLRWTFEPMIHDKPVPPPNMSMYLTGDGIVTPIGDTSFGILEHSE